MIADPPRQCHQTLNFLDKYLDAMKKESTQKELKPPLYPQHTPLQLQPPCSLTSPDSSPRLNESASISISTSFFTSPPLFIPTSNLWILKTNVFDIEIICLFGASHWWLFQYNVSSPNYKVFSRTWGSRPNKRINLIKKKPQSIKWQTLNLFSDMKSCLIKFQKQTHGKFSFPWLPNVPPPPLSLSFSSFMKQRFHSKYCAKHKFPTKVNDYTAHSLPSCLVIYVYIILCVMGIS